MDEKQEPEERQYLQPEQVMPWIEAAQSGRLNADVLEHLMPPREGSSLRPNADSDPFKNMAWWSYGYLEAAADHLLLWADYAAPPKFHPDSEVTHTLRPAFTLARATIESAAQAIWILSPEEQIDRVRRYVQLATWDLDEQTKAAESPEGRAVLQARRDELFAGMGITRRQWRPPKYLEMIREAAEFMTIGDETGFVSPDRIERVWRSAAGAAHGKRWTEFELQDRTDAGNGLVLSTPRIEAISEVLEAASKYLSAGVILFAIRAGHMEHFGDLWQEATIRLAERITPRDGEVIRRKDVPDFRVSDVWRE